MTALNICTTYHQRFLLPAKFELLGRPPAADEIRDVAFHFRQVKKQAPTRRGIIRSNPATKWWNSAGDGI